MAIAPALVLENVHKTWRAGAGECRAHVHALRGVDLVVRAGTLVALAGDAGAGKSTLLLCAAGLARPDDGAVRVAGSGALPDAVRSALYLDAAHRQPGSPSAATEAGARSPVVREPAPGIRLLLVDSLDRAADALHVLARLRAFAGSGIAVVAATRDDPALLHALRRAGARVVRLAQGRITGERPRVPSASLELRLAPAGAAERLRAAGITMRGSGDIVRVPLDGTTAEEVLARCLALRVSVCASRVVREG